MDLKSREIVLTKALISFAVTAKLICAFVFAYAECWFSLDAAHLFQVNKNNTYVHVRRRLDLYKSIRQDLGYGINHNSSYSRLQMALVNWSCELHRDTCILRRNENATHIF